MPPPKKAPRAARRAGQAPAPAAAGGLPRVLLVDIDGTLVGRVHALLCEVDVLQSAMATDATATALRAARAAIIARLRYGVIRPHVEAFFRAAAADVEPFIYTASTPEWAAFLVPCMETALGVRFNRPLFTRAHCAPAPGGGVRKSIQRVLPDVVRALRRKYPALRSPRDLLAHGRVHLVDNTPDVVAPAERAMLIACPTYDYQYWYDVLHHVSVDVQHERFRSLVPVLRQYELYPEGLPLPGSYQEFAATYYAHLGRRLHAAQTANARHLRQDAFWLRLAHAPGT